jgi:formylglycine-generating enzyme required for sulfatase activity
MIDYTQTLLRFSLLTQSYPIPLHFPLLKGFETKLVGKALRRAVRPYIPPPIPSAAEPKPLMPLPHVEFPSSLWNRAIQSCVPPPYRSPEIGKTAMEWTLYSKWLGIPEKETRPDYYELFGLPRCCENQKDIDTASRRAIGEIRKRQLDPKFKDEVQALLSELAKARAVLKNPARKSLYDRWLIHSGGVGDPPKAVFTASDRLPKAQSPSVDPDETARGAVRKISAAMQEKTESSAPAAPEALEPVLDEFSAPTRKLSRLTILGGLFGAAAVVFLGVILLWPASNELPLQSKTKKKSTRTGKRKKRPTRRPKEPSAGLPSDSPNVGDYRELLKAADRLHELGSKDQATRKYNAAFEAFSRLSPAARPDNGRFPFETANLRFSSRNEQGYFEFVWQKDGAIMVYVPGGIFRAGFEGADPDQDSGALDARPRDEYIGPFLIDKYEVTNDRYAVFLKAFGKKPLPAGYRHPLAPEKGPNPPPQAPGAPEWGFPNHPVTGVSWNDAFAYSRWCGKQLPSYLEWEKAAAWNEKDGTKYKYPIGNTWASSKVNCQERWSTQGASRLPKSLTRIVAGKPWEKKCYSLPVGSLEDISPYGIHDMTGNLQEYCLESVTALIAADQGKDLPITGPTRVCCGGAWCMDASMCVVGRKDEHPLNARHLPWAGFRTVRRIIVPSDRITIYAAHKKLQSGEKVRCRAFLKRAKGRETPAFPQWSARAGTVGEASGVFSCKVSQTATVQVRLPGTNRKGSFDFLVSPYNGPGWAPAQNHGRRAPDALPETLRKGSRLGEYVHKKTGMVFVYHPGGPSLLGAFMTLSPRVRPIRLPGFFVGKYEVTLAQYQAFEKAAGGGKGWYSHPKEPPAQSYAFSHVSGLGLEGQNPATLPIYNGNYFMARAFAAWAGLHLPTEAQWEAAACCDTVLACTRMFPWGDAWNRMLSNNACYWADRELQDMEAAKKYFEENPDVRTPSIRSIGSFPKNVSPCGAFDMAGNVAEYCLDRSDINPAEARSLETRDPVGAVDSSRVSAKGGDCWAGNYNLLAASQWTCDPKQLMWPLGFRCVVNPALVPKRLVLFPKDAHEIPPGFPCLLRAVLHFACGRTQNVKALWTSDPPGIDPESGRLNVTAEGVYAVTAVHQPTGLRAKLRIRVCKNDSAPWPAELNAGITPPPSLPEGMRRGEKPGEYIWTRDGSIMAWIPSGRHWIGHRGYDNARWADLDGFFMDRFEVTNHRFNVYLKKRKADADPKRYDYPYMNDQSTIKSKVKPGTGGDKHPVVHVNWLEAWAYAKWSGKSLPTAEEWEVAGGVHPVTKKKTSFPWGNVPQPDCANVSKYWNWKKGTGRILPVGSFPKDRTVSGCFDLVGNVKEWCLYDARVPLSIFLPYSMGKDGSRRIMRFLRNGLTRPVRGGCYRNSFPLAHTIMGVLKSTDTTSDWIGFRCVVRPGGAAFFLSLATAASKNGRPDEACQVVKDALAELGGKPMLHAAFDKYFMELLDSIEGLEKDSRIEDANDGHTNAKILALNVAQKAVAHKLFLRFRVYAKEAIPQAERALKYRNRPQLVNARKRLEEVMSKYPDSHFAQQAFDLIQKIDAILKPGEGEPKPKEMKKGSEKWVRMLLKELREDKSEGGPYSPCDVGVECAAHIDLFIEALQDKRNYTQRSRGIIRTAVINIGKTGGEPLQKAVDLFIRLATNPPPAFNPYNTDAIQALGKLGWRASKAVPHLVLLLPEPLPKNSSWSKASSILRALGKMGLIASLDTKKILAYLKTPLKSGIHGGLQGSPTMLAIEALGRIVPKEDGKEEVAALVAFVKKEPGFRGAVLKALASIHRADSVVLNYLKELLANSDNDVRISAAHVLAQLGPLASAAVPALMNSFKKHIELRSGHRGGLEAFPTSVVDAFAKIGPKAKPAVPMLYKAWQKRKITAKALLLVIAGLGRAGRGYLPTVEEVRKVMGSSFSGMLKTYVYVALGRKKLAALIKGLSKDDKGNQKYAARYLGFLGSKAKAAVPDLILLLNRKHADTRLLVIEALEKIGLAEPAVEKALRQALDDEKTQDAAFRALDRLGLWKK